MAAESGPLLSGRAGTVHAAPFHEDGLARIVIRSGDLVRRLDERWADDHELVPDDHEESATADVS